MLLNVHILVSLAAEFSGEYVWLGLAVIVALSDVEPHILVLTQRLQSRYQHFLCVSNLVINRRAAH